jgi:hypothetical protein
MNELLELDMHPFVLDVLQKSVEMQKQLGVRHLAKVDPDYKREPDEHEFFHLGCGTCLAEVLDCCHQLHQIPVYLGNHRQTPAMERAGINRHSQIVYHVENYIIRTQSLLDRMLKLVDAVFHLLNDPRNCRYDVVIKNVKVQVSDVPESIKSLRTLLNRYSAVRSEVVHHHSIKEDDLRYLDMLFLAQRYERFSPRPNLPNVSGLVKESTQEVLRGKKKEFVEFNKEIASAITHVFDKLAPYYTREEAALRLRLSKPSN